MPRVSRNYLINSENRVSGTTSSFGYYIPNDGQYTHCIVLGANIPVSYYLIQAPYNKFTLYENNVPIEIEIPVGNYNVSSFQIVVQNLLNTNTQIGNIYEISFANDYEQHSTGKYTFTCTNTSSPEPQLVFDNNGEVHAQFGFSHASANTFVNGVLQSETVVNFISETVLTISSDLCDDTNLLTIFYDNAEPYSIISFQAQSDLYGRKLRTGGKDSLYQFSVLSRNGHKLDLNGLPAVMDLLLYREDHSWKTDIQNYIKYKVYQESSNNNQTQDLFSNQSI